MPLRASPLPREKVENLNLNGYLAKMYSLAIVCMRKRKISRRSKILQSTLKIDLQTINVTVERFSTHLDAQFVGNEIDCFWN